MNVCEVTGWIQGAPELRITRDGARILNFEIAVDGDHEPYVPIGFVIRGGGAPDLHAGMKVFVHGALMYHRTRGLVLAATKIRAIANEPRPEAFRAHEGAEYSEPHEDLITEKNWARHLDLGEPGAKR